MINQQGQNRNPEELALSPAHQFAALFPTPRELILIGAGHAHVLLLRKFGTHPLGNIRVTLISDVEHAAYSGCCRAISVVSTAGRKCLSICASLCDFSGARFIHSQASGIDLKRKQVLIGLNGSTLPADVISINTGGTSRMAGVAGADRMGNSNEARAATCCTVGRVVQAAAAHARMRIVVVGGGAGGVELTLAMHSQLQKPS